jgi:hypothetical protein
MPAGPATGWFDDDVMPVEGRPVIPRQPRPNRKPARKDQNPKRGRSRKPTTTARRSSAAVRAGARSSQRGQAAQWGRIAPVYDVDGPRVRYGVLWFMVAAVGVLLSAAGAAIVYGAVAGFAARQTVRAWRCPPTSADAAGILAVVPVLVATLGVVPGALALAAVAAVAFFVGLGTPGAGLGGATGRVAAVAILLHAVVPVAVAGAAMVVVRDHSVAAALVLLGLASVYEMGDFLVGSGSSNPVEGPLAGGAAVILVGFPLALLLIEPFDVMGVAMLGVAAVCCPIGQWVASAVLPRPGAKAPALRRMDTLLLLAPVWAVATAAVL